MRVLLSPQAAGPSLAADVAARLAGPCAAVTSLRDAGVPDLSRVLSRAEVTSLRRAIVGAGSGEAALRPRSPEDVLVGYVCRGRPGPGVPAGATRPPVAPARLILVTDHADLTWRSPLRGPNDSGLGPRFPVVAGVYRPEAASAVEAAWDEAVGTGVVAQVEDAAALTGWEEEIVRGQGFVAVTEELAPVVVVAAHLGYGVAAMVVLE